MLGCGIGSGVAAVAGRPLPAPARAIDLPPGASLPATMVRRYTMSGSVRPLLFWIGRDDIGAARIVWRRDDEGARGYELLIGTDPAHAPRALNRWGYIAEEVLGADGSMLALMTRADETGYEEAAASAAGRPTGGEFRAIRARVGGGAATWQVATASTHQPLTFHDLDAALDRVGNELISTAHRRMQVSGGVRPGFLVALAELLDRAVRIANERRDGAALQPLRLEYLFGGAVYELRLRHARPGIEPVQNTSAPIVRTTFEIRTPATNARTRFDVVCGTEGSLAGVPVFVAWQPRWWLAVSLRLVD
jgi:hypothetical protein